MKNYFILLTILLSTITFGQVGVGTSTPNASSKLDVESADAGILIPRVTLTSTTDATTITNGNVESLLVYNTATIADITPGYYYWNATDSVWERLTSVSDDIDFWENTTLASGETGIKYKVSPVGEQVFVSDLGSVLIGEDNSSSGVPVIRNGLINTNEYIEGSTESRNTLSSYRLETGATSNFVESTRNAIIEAPTNTDPYNRIIAATNIGIKNGAGDGVQLIGSRNRAQISPSASGAITNLISVRAENDILADVSVFNNIGILTTIGKNTTVTNVTNTYGLKIEGDGLGLPNRAGRNRYGLHISDVVESTIQTGGETFSIYTNQGTVSFGDNAEQRGTGYFKVATGTTAERPASPEAGMIRFNTTTNRLECYNGSVWINL